MNDRQAWTDRVEADGQLMIDAGLAYLDAGGTDEQGLSAAIWAAAPHVSGGVYTVVRARIRELRGV